VTVSTTRQRVRIDLRLIGADLVESFRFLRDHASCVDCS
jgi:hypothetical protein